MSARLAGFAAVGPHRDPSWQARAACRAADPDLFFPAPGPSAPAELEKARAICARCPVRAVCLAYAQDNAIVDGVWGGLTPDERRARRRGQANARRLKRNAAIIAARAAGATQEQIAREFSVTASLVGKILAAHERRSA